MKDDLIKRLRYDCDDGLRDEAADEIERLNRTLRQQSEAVADAINRHHAQIIDKDTEIDNLRAELNRINNLANCGSVDSWMTLSDEQKRVWFAVTLHVDSEKAKIIREFHDAWPGGLDEIEAAIKCRDDEIERLREEVQRLSARLIEDRHAAEIAHESATAPLEALHQAVRRYFRTEADRVEHEKARAAMREAMHAVNDAMENEE